MLLFKRHHVPKILDGHKTETRRDTDRNIREGGTHQARINMPWQDDASGYFADIEIKKVWDHRLGDIGADSVLAEGYNSLERFKQVWIEINGSWNPDQEVTAIRFNVVPRWGPEDWLKKFREFVSDMDNRDEATEYYFRKAAKVSPDGPNAMLLALKWRDNYWSDDSRF